MEDGTFQIGEQLWLRGRPVIFVGYQRHAAHRIGVAAVRRPNGTTARVVPLWKLAKDRAEAWRVRTRCRPVIAESSCARCRPTPEAPQSWIGTHT
jgi:hypothetical protein